MARENFVYLYGQVISQPRLRVKDGEAKSAVFSMKVLRRPSNGQELESKVFYDCPVIRTQNAEMIAVIRDIAEGDMVLCRGVLTTREYKKSTICPECGDMNTVYGNIVYVTPILLRIEERNKDIVEGTNLLKQNNEISNNVVLIGNLCRNPEFYQDEKKRTYAQYQLAVNRRYRIKEDPDSVRTDYPWIKTFGLQATNDSRCLEVGSSVYISGALQTREISRKTVCQCNCEYTWDETVAEVVPYYIGYLENCHKEEIKEDSADNLENVAECGE